MRTSLLVAAVVAFAGCTKGQEGKASLPAKSEAAPPAPAPPVPVTQAAPENNPAPVAAAPVVAPDAGSSSVKMRLTGQVTSQRASKLAFKQSGFVATTAAKPGSIVKKGDILASLEDEDFEVRLQLAKARRDLAKVGQEAAKKELDRELQLKKENASTGSVLDKIQAGFDQARLQARLAELDVTLAERALNDTKLRAPYDCVVAIQSKYEGENVQSGNVAYEVYDLANPEITFEAPERLMGKLTIGDRLEVLIPSSGYAGQAEVVRVVPVIAEKTRTFRVIARPGKADGVVPGSFAEATLN